MKRTTVRLPDDLDANVRDQAARRGVAVSEIMREAILVYLGAARRNLMAAGTGHSGLTDVSEQVEEILHEIEPVPAQVELVHEGRFLVAEPESEMVELTPETVEATRDVLLQERST